MPCYDIAYSYIHTAYNPARDMQGQSAVIAYTMDEAIAGLRRRVHQDAQAGRFEVTAARLVQNDVLIVERECPPVPEPLRG